MSEDDSLSPAAVRVSSRRKRNSTLSRRSAWQKSSLDCLSFLSGDRLNRLIAPSH